LRHGLAGAGERPRESLVREGLHEVIDRGDVECVDRVPVVRGHEDGGRHRGGPHGAHHVHPRHAGHLYFEKHDVGRQPADRVDRRDAVFRRRDHLDVGRSPEQGLDVSPDRRLVVDDEHAQPRRHGSGSGCLSRHRSSSNVSE
jgi:hypothetical protein